MSPQDNVAAANPALSGKVQRLEAVDAMLRGRYRQGSFIGWLRRRIRDLYPK